jgi:class 3 adenylate cyclase
MQDTGKIVSDVINTASHLEKKATEPGGVSITEDVFTQLPDKYQKLFIKDGDFEGSVKYRSGAVADN